MERDPHADGQSDISVLRRLGSTPQQRGSTSALTCPDVFALSDGSIGCIGTDLTEKLRHRLPAGAAIGSHERLVAVPRQAVHDALPDIMKFYRLTDWGRGSGTRLFLS